MRKGLLPLSVAAMIGGLGFAGLGSFDPMPRAQAQPSADPPSAEVQKTRTTGTVGPATKAARALFGWARWARAPRGKRYSASVRQHQRHAAKARRRQAERRRSK